MKSLLIIICFICQPLYFDTAYAVTIKDKIESFKNIRAVMTDKGVDMSLNPTLWALSLNEDTIDNYLIIDTQLYQVFLTSEATRKTKLLTAKTYLKNLDRTKVDSWEKTRDLLFKVMDLMGR